MKKLIMTMLMTIVVASGFGQDELPNKRVCSRKVDSEGYTTITEKSNQYVSLHRTDGHYFNIIPAIQGNKKEIETDTLTTREINSRRYTYDEITKKVYAKFEDDHIEYYGNNEAQFKEFLYDNCYECIDNGNELYCEIYYYYNINDNRLNKWEKQTLANIDRNIQDRTRQYEEDCKDTKESSVFDATQKQKLLNSYTRNYQSSIQEYNKDKEKVMDNHINIELKRALYVRNIIYGAYPARIKFVKVTDINQKNKITIVISNYKDEYRKN